MRIDFENAFIAGVSRVAAWADLVDKINVFPIADGDTGSKIQKTIAVRVVDPYALAPADYQRVFPGKRGG